MLKSKTIRNRRHRNHLAVEQLEAREVPAVIISEIMYNPASTEGPPPNRVEWVELYNNGATAETLTNAYLTDVTESGATGRSGNFSVTIPPRGAVVLFPDSITLADFRAAWGATVPGVPVSNWGRNCRAGHLCLRNETQGTDGEHVQLHRSDGMILDEVNYRTNAPWPQLTTQGGPSISLRASALNAVANDNPANWFASQVGVAGARNNWITPIFNHADTGSPGSVGVGAVASMVASRLVGPTQMDSAQPSRIEPNISSIQSSRPGWEIPHGLRLNPTQGTTTVTTLRTTADGARSEVSVSRSPSVAIVDALLASEADFLSLRLNEKAAAAAVC
jgi:hypothetical protein